MHNTLFGLFIDNRLVCTAGYTTFGSANAMLGRLRTDIRYQGQGYSKQLTQYVRNQAFQAQALEWLGANTQKNNIPAQQVLNSSYFEKQTLLYGCTAQSIDNLLRAGNVWPKTTQLKEKQNLLHTYHVNKHTFFPIECYYPFPSTSTLFQEEAKQIEDWRFFQEGDLPPLVTKTDTKKEAYLHAVYPYEDLFQRPGLWETIVQAQKDLQNQCPDETVHVWMDIPASIIHQLPEDHPFELDSPWLLYGMDRNTWKNHT
ncbi:GNAT family N-acetyltransferase [Oceanobacillus locisalsi]|uniref:GNAT family N-acetyltransferase n=1 Tax=Oceanobacillus locisalsi TaxID=546107 RepID=A0ABW3NIM4_9BACI